MLFSLRDKSLAAKYFYPKRYPTSAPKIASHLYPNLVQIVPSPEKKKANADSLGLVEVGPRLTLNPIKILEGSFGGPVLYSNPTYVSPNLVSPSTLQYNSCSS